MGKEPKTKENDRPVEDFIQALEKEKQQEQSFILLELFETASKAAGRMWGASIIGFGHYPQKYADGRVIEWLRGGFSPRKGKFALYLMNDFESYESYLSRLGKYKTSKACLYINKLEDIDIQVLRELLHASFVHMEEKYPL